MHNYTNYKTITRNSINLLLLRVVFIPVSKGITIITEGKK